MMRAFVPSAATASEATTTSGLGSGLGSGSQSKQVWSTNRCVLSTYFFFKFEERRTDQQTYLPVEVQFYISVMFLGLPVNTQEEKPSFFLF